MRQRLRIQVRPRWENDEAPPELPRAKPVPRPFKWIAGAGILAFWLFYFGLVGEGGNVGAQRGFIIFALCQVPMLWFWMRNAARRM
ncbi:MAG: hypothetical protein JO218_10210 [Burkholderiales bacterium]|nr:hypothetical protein [Burkholderiales bacterium]